jgi:chromosome segregation ATPase
MAFPVYQYSQLTPPRSSASVRTEVDRASSRVAAFEAVLDGLARQEKEIYDRPLGIAATVREQREAILDYEGALADLESQKAQKQTELNDAQDILGASLKELANSEDYESRLAARIDAYQRYLAACQAVVKEARELVRLGDSSFNIVSVSYQSLPSGLISTRVADIERYDGILTKIFGGESQ